jgi:glucose/mannose-6-phosphate isomerase
MPAKNKDSLNILSSIEAFPDQCDQANRELEVFHLPPEYCTVSNVVVSGMGGSALGARFINSFTACLRKPLLISTEYHLPAVVNADSLVIVSSYSGNTDETLHSLQEAETRNAKIIIICTGGKLQTIAAQKHLPAYIINPVHNPSSQPRMGLGYSIFSLLKILSRVGAVQFPQNFSQIISDLRSHPPDLKTYQTLALSLQGKIPVLISSEHLFGAAHAFKNQLNENAKTFAVSFDLPELNHHLLEGFSHPSSNPENLSVIFITSKYYSPQIISRYPITQDVVAKNKIPYQILPLSAPDKLTEGLELIRAGCYTSYFLALINGVDPGPIPWVDWYKDEIRQVV